MGFLKPPLKKFRYSRNCRFSYYNKLELQFRSEVPTPANIHIYACIHAHISKQAGVYVHGISNRVSQVDEAEKKSTRIW